MNTSVIISGAGPTGLTLAVELARMNIDFIIIDKKPGITELSKALGIQARTLELFEDMGIAQSFVERGNKNGKGNIVVRGNIRGTIEISNLGAGQSPYPYLLVLPQNETEEILYEELQSYEKEVFWNTELVDFQQAEGVVEARLRMADGTIKKVNASYLVGCDGASSFVRKNLGLKFHGSTHPKYFFVIDLKVDWRFGHGDDFYMCMAKNDFVLMLPMKGENRFRGIGIIPTTIENPQNANAKDICKLIKKSTQIDMEISEVNWHSVYKVHTRKADTFKKDRCFIAGDAAHVHTPAGGQGMNTGIQDAYNLAWKLKMVLKEEADEIILNTYDFEREQNARDLLNTTDRAFEFQTGDNPFIRFIRLNIFPSIANTLLRTGFIKNKLFPLISQIGIKYPGSRLTEESKVGSIEGGDRLPYFKLSDGTSIYDKVKGVKFHLLTTSKLDNLDLPPFVKVQMIKELPVEIFGTQKETMILVRPDNYISYIGNNTNELMKFIKGDLFVQSKLISA